MTTWSPDTCGCQIEIDDTTGLPSQHLVRCTRHNIGTADDAANAFADNRTKNMALADIKIRAPKLEVGWSFDADGTLAFILPANASAPDVASVHAAVARYAKARVA